MFCKYQKQFTVCLSNPRSVHFRQSSRFAFPHNVLYITDRTHSLLSTSCSVYIRHRSLLATHLMFCKYQTLFNICLTTPCSVHFRHSSQFAPPPHFLYISDTVLCLHFQFMFCKYQTQFTVCLSNPWTVHFRQSSRFAFPHNFLYITDRTHSLLSTSCSVYIRHRSLFATPPHVL